MIYQYAYYCPWLDIIIIGDEQRDYILWPDDYGNYMKAIYLGVL